MSDNTEPQQEAPPTAIPIPDEPAEEVKPTRRRGGRRKASEPEQIADDVDQVLADAQQANGPDVFDQAIADRQQEQQTSFMDRARARLGKPNHGQGGEARTPLPDPHFFAGINLTDEKDGPRIHLGRSNTGRHKGSNGDMIILFDERPEGEVGELILQSLRDHDFQWTGKSWAKEMDGTAHWRSQAEAERLFKDIANTMREANGLEPVTMMGVPDRP